MKRYLARTLILLGAILITGCSNAGSGGATSPGGGAPEASAPYSTQSEAGASQSTDSLLDLETRLVTLNDGNQMPIVGLGTWTQNSETAENSVYEALKDGYRLIDTARYYGNAAGVQAGVKRAIDEGIVTREEVFIATKIIPSGIDDYRAAIDELNESLGLDYIDLLFIHYRAADEVELYRAIEDAIDDGVVHSLGISNYYTPDEFEQITEDARIMPAVIQNESHPFFQNSAFQQYVGEQGVIIMSYYPFGGRGHTQDLFGHETITAIAEDLGKTPAQVLVRWQLQIGRVPIPGSKNPDHIAENIDVFDFELTNDQMRQIQQMNTNTRYETW